MKVAEESQVYFSSGDSGLSLRRNTCVLDAEGRTKAHVDATVPRPSSMIVPLVPCRPSIIRQDLPH